MNKQLDDELARKYGSHVSYASEYEPHLVEYYGDSPRVEMRRLLDSYTNEESVVLDIGCGAGQTLCDLAMRVKHIWGVDHNAELLQACRERIAETGIQNASLLFGDTVDPTVVAQLPDDAFTVAFSQRGPNIHAPFMPKLRKEAVFIQELVSSLDGDILRIIFGRSDYAPYKQGEVECMLNSYAELDLFPVSVKEYFYDSFFQDITRFEAYLYHAPAMLSNWRLEDKPYQPERDRVALELYARYNTTPQGIRLRQHHRVFVFRRIQVTYYPVG